MLADEGLGLLAGNWRWQNTMLCEIVSEPWGEYGRQKRSRGSCSANREHGIEECEGRHMEEKIHKD